MLRRILFLAGWATLFPGLHAEPLSKKTDIDFFRDVPSRNLKGLASRSDGRLVSGPTLSELAVNPPAELLWCLEPTPDPTRWLVGTGPNGRIVEVTFDITKATYAARDFAKLDDPQVFAVKRLADGSVLAGTSPRGGLHLIRNEKPVTRLMLPVDSIYDIVLIDAGTALVATGNPGRIYRVDVAKFAAAGLNADKVSDAKVLAERGVTLFGEVRDRNIRRIVAMPDGRIAAGSAPRGNLYSFPKDGGAPVILQENRESEVTDLLPQPNGDLYATLVSSATERETRMATPPTKSGREREEPPPPVQVERFSGRSTLVWLPANGFPEVLASRNGMAFYRVVRHRNVLLMAGGEQGELVGYDMTARLSVTYAGSISSQLNGLAPLAGVDGKFLVLRNNAPGFAVLDFGAAGPREAESRRLDLGGPAQLGAVRFNRLRELAPTDVNVEVRVSNGSDDVEGWTPWTRLTAAADGGWRAQNLRGRYVKLRLTVAPPATPASAARQFEIDRAAIFSLPQNRRPQLQDFRVLSPGFGVIAAPAQPPSAVVSLNRLLEGNKDEDRRKEGFFSSQVVPAPGAQVVLWTVTDPDGDAFTCTFSIRRDGEPNWTDVVANTRESYAQFDTGHLPDGIYFTRLVAIETAPRPPADRLTHVFETDDLVVDHTAPELLESSARREGDSVIVTVRGRDTLSLLDGIEVVFNNGVRETVEQPVDGIRDGREESFSIDLPFARVSNASSVEVTIYDASGNSAAKRLTW